MNPATKIKKYLLSLFLINLMLFYTNAAYAASTPAYSGVQASIEQYLCHPTEGAGHYWSDNGSYTRQGPDTPVAASNQAQYDLYKCINTLYKFAIAIGTAAAVLMIVIAGYLYMSSDGNQESVDKAKNIITTTITAMVILFGGYVLLRTINPDLISFQSVQPKSVKLDTMAPPLEGTGGVPANLINKTGIQGCGGTTDGSNCDDYTLSKYGLTGNASQHKGQNTFLTKTLIAKLVALKSKYPDFRINEAYPPTVDHSDSCHATGSCADIGTNNKVVSEVNKLCLAIGTNLSITNEYFEFKASDMPNCTNPTKYNTTTSGHLHVR